MAGIAGLQKARQNMLECQITPNGVINPAVISAFAETPREVYMPADMQGIAYADKNMNLAGGRYVLAPMVHAKMLEILNPPADGLALDVACGFGYSSAVLSKIVSTVVAIDPDRSMLERAVRTWQAQGIGNIAEYVAGIDAGDIAHAPFDAIVINGALGRIPESLTAQLKPGGRLVGIVRKPDAVMGQVVLMQRDVSGHVSSRVMFEAAAGYLPGGAPEVEFAF